MRIPLAGTRMTNFPLSPIWVPVTDTNPTDANTVLPPTDTGPTADTGLPPNPLDTVPAAEPIAASDAQYGWLHPIDNEIIIPVNIPYIFDFPLETEDCGTELLHVLQSWECEYMYPALMRNFIFTHLNFKFCIRYLHIRVNYCKGRQLFVAVLKETDKSDLSKVIFQLPDINDGPKLHFLALSVAPVSVSVATTSVVTPIKKNTQGIPSEVVTIARKSTAIPSPTAADDNEPDKPNLSVALTKMPQSGNIFAYYNSTKALSSGIRTQLTEAIATHYSARGPKSVSAKGIWAIAQQIVDTFKGERIVIEFLFNLLPYMI